MTASPPFDLHVRGRIPTALDGTVLVATARRPKDRRLFRRWHDSQAELLRLDVRPGSPGRVTASFLEIDPSGDDIGYRWPKPLGGPPHPYFRYITQPNHAVNVTGHRVWMTNLLFGAPLEIDLRTFRATRALPVVELSPDTPQCSSTAHFAWSLDGRFAYYHQSLLQRESPDSNVRFVALTLVELNCETGEQRTWPLQAPGDDADDRYANFHSAFYFEESGRRFVGLLRTGAVLERLDPHPTSDEHPVCRMPFSTIWIVEIRYDQAALQATLLEGLEHLQGIALSHLEVDNSGRDGFVLFANYKQADVGEETHGINVYGEPPEAVTEHYAGAVTEPVNFGTVLRYERRHATHRLASFSSAYDFERTSLGHSWMPINLKVDSSGRRLFCSFAGFKPRLLPAHIARAYAGLTADYSVIRFVPPVLMCLDADTLERDSRVCRNYISYQEPIAFTLVRGEGRDFVLTFSPEVGLRIYDADDLSTMLAHAASAELHTWRDTHLRPDPAHMTHVQRQ